MVLGAAGSDPETRPGATLIPYVPPRGEPERGTSGFPGSTARAQIHRPSREGWSYSQGNGVGQESMGLDLGRGQAPHQRGHKVLEEKSKPSELPTRTARLCCSRVCCGPGGVVSGCWVTAPTASSGSPGSAGSCPCPGGLWGGWQPRGALPVASKGVPGAAGRCERWRGAGHRDGPAPPRGIHGQNSKGEAVTPPLLHPPCPAVAAGVTLTRPFLALPVALEQEDALCWEAPLEATGSSVRCSRPPWHGRGLLPGPAELCAGRTPGRMINEYSKLICRN